MTTIYINEKTDTGKRVLREIAENTQIEKVEDFTVTHDKNGKPIGYTVEEIFAEVDVNLFEAYGVDFAKIMQMLNSGEIKENELTDELLLSSQFKYKPYPGFKQKSLSHPHIELVKALVSEP